MMKSDIKNLNLPPFLPGDKVVYIGGNNNPEVIEPPLNTPITILEKCPWCADCGHYRIKEYLHSRVPGQLQNFHYTHLRKIQESKFRAVSFEKIMEETEKICVN